MSTRIHDRWLSSEVFLYIRAGLWVMLYNRDIESQRESAHLEYPYKFICPYQDGEMVFCNDLVAAERNGMAFKLVMSKKYPQGDIVSTLENFIAKYAKKSSYTLKYLDHRTFRKISEILSQKPSFLRPRFKHPYQIKQGIKTSEIVECLRDIAEKNLGSQALIKNFIDTYCPGTHEVAPALIKATHITPLAPYLSNAQLSRYFIDLRKQVSIGDAVENIKKILERIEKPHYEIRINSQVLSCRENWMSKISPAQSLGIRNIHSSDLVPLRQRVFDDFFHHYRHQIEDLVTGRLIFGEISKDLAQKKQRGTRTQELVNLLPQFEDLKYILKKQGKKYPNVDGQIRAIQIIAFFLFLHLIIWALALQVHGSYAERIWHYHGFFLEYPPFQSMFSLSARRVFDITGIMAAIWSMMIGCLTIAIGRRKARIMLWWNFCLWSGMCIAMFAWNPLCGLIHIPWVLASAYGVWILPRSSTKAHFYPEFGTLYAPISLIGKMAILSAIAALATYLAHITMVRY